MKRILQGVLLAAITLVPFRHAAGGQDEQKAQKARILKNELLRAAKIRQMTQPRGATATSRTQAGKPGVAYYSAQRKYPPLPFNPFPELPVQSLGDGNFVYDDRKVNYERLRDEAVQFQAAEADQPVEAQGEDGPAPSPNGPQGAGALCLLISKVDAGHFQLIASNLTVGNDYLLTDKLELLDDIRVNWTPLLLFTATGPTATFQGAFVEEKDFFRVWDLNAYTGPFVNLTAPSAGSTLSGKVKVKGGVSDIFSDRVAELYVDGDFHRAITNGPLHFDLDTQQFGNGPHTLDVVVRTVQFGTDRLEYATAASIGTVTFENFLTSIDNVPLFSPDLGAPTFVFATTGPADYQMDITDESQNLVRTYAGSTAGGSFQIAWDLLDQSNIPVPLETSYTVTMTTASQGADGGPGQLPLPATNQVVINTYAEGTFNAAHSYLLYLDFVFNQQLREQVDRDLMNAIHGFITFADLFGPDPTDTRTVLNEQVVQWTTASQKTNILSAIKRRDVGHVFFKGHGADDLFGSGDDTPFQANIDVSDLRLTLTNSYNQTLGTYSFKNPKRYVEIDSCNTGEGELPLAFGIPKFRIDGRPNMKRRTYFSWIGTIEIAAWENRYVQHIRTQNAYWHSVDGDPITIRDAIRQAIIAHNFQIDIRETRLYGSSLLLWAVAAQ